MYPTEIPEYSLDQAIDLLTDNKIYKLLPMRIRFIKNPCQGSVNMTHGKNINIQKYLKQSFRQIIFFPQKTAEK